MARRCQAAEGAAAAAYASGGHDQLKRSKSETDQHLPKEGMFQIAFFV